MAKIILGGVLGLLIIPVSVWVYFQFGNPPVAVADHPFPFEKQIVKVPLHARIDRQMPHTVPFTPTADDFLAGAQTYRENCAFCHGLPGRNSDVAPHMYPPTPQLFRTHRPGVVGVSDDPAGETYWKIANGIRLTGMPSFDKILSQRKMWQVALLLKNANTTFPDNVTALLSQPLFPPAAPPVPQTVPAKK